jgi:hypothetical protein
MPKAKQPAGSATAADPDKLVKQTAGTYRTADDRFEVRNGGTGWFLVDTAQANDFGQELILGPYATLAAVRAAIPPARSSKVTPIRPPATKTARSAGRKAPEKAAKPPTPASWIDRLPAREAEAVRARIAALERAGIADADGLVRRDREGVGPAVATRLIEHRLEEIVGELPERGRPGARELMRRAAELLTAEGTTRSKGLPGWTLVELDSEAESAGEPPNRRIIVRELPDG